MNKLFYLILSITLILSSCDKGEESTPPGTTPGGGTEQPGNGNGNEPGGNKPDPEPKPDPEYDPETQVLIAGIVWDKENALDYCTFDEALEAAKKAGKRIPSFTEWMLLRDAGYTWDGEKKGYWHGEDSEKLSESEKSIFLPALGYIGVSWPNQIISESIGGNYWSYGYKQEPAYFVAYSHINVMPNPDIPLHTNARTQKDVLFCARFIK